MSTDGQDNASGSETQPFKTLQACVDKHRTMNKPTGTCKMKGGRYPDMVTVSKYPTENFGSLSIEAVEGETPVIDGSKELLYTWTQDPTSQCKWSTSIPNGETIPWFLWVKNADGSMTPLTPARWPNAKFSDFSVFNTTKKPVAYSTSSFGPAGVLADYGVELTLESDELKGVNMDFTDTYVVQSMGSLAQWSIGGKVISSNSVSGEIVYTLPDKWKTITSGGSAEFPAFGGHKNLPFFFEGHPKLLDSEEEWSFFEGKLSVWMPNCANPNDFEIRGRVRDISLITDNMDNVSMKVLSCLEQPLRTQRQILPS